MKVKGCNVKGIKKAVGEYNLYKDNSHAIFFNGENMTVFCVPHIVGNVLQETQIKFYLVDLTAIIKDVYPENYPISMETVKAVLREYVL